MSEEAPERIWMHMVDADCWCCYHSDQDEDVSHLTEFVPATALQEKERENADLHTRLTARENELRMKLYASPSAAIEQARREVWDAAIAIVEKLVCAPQFEGNWRNGYSHAQNDAFRALEAARTADIKTAR